VSKRACAWNANSGTTLVCNQIYAFIRSDPAGIKVTSYWGRQLQAPQRLFVLEQLIGDS
jgi:hypothetical protein